MSREFTFFSLQVIAFSKQQFHTLLRMAENDVEFNKQNMVVVA